MILKKFKSTAIISVTLSLSRFVWFCYLLHNFDLFGFCCVRCKSVSQQEIVSLYQRFCQLDRNAKGFISADEFLSVPEFAMNPLSQRLLKMVDGLNFKDFVAFLSAFSAKASAQQKIALIFKVYDSDYNGKVTFNDILEVLRDLTGSFMSDDQREHVLNKVMLEAGYTRESSLALDDFMKVLGKSELKMEVEIPVD